MAALPLPLPFNNKNNSLLSVLQFSCMIHFMIRMSTTRLYLLSNLSYNAGDELRSNSGIINLRRCKESLYENDQTLRGIRKYTAKYLNVVKPVFNKTAF